MEPSLARYIWTHTHRQQLWILLIVAVSMVPYYMAFDLPKQIVNGPIQGGGFETAGATELFMRLEYDLPLFGKVLFFPGIELDRLQMLMGLSLAFLALVIVNGLFKFYINTYKGRLGERLLRRIRFELIDRILRFPPHYFRRIKGGEISSMVKDEVEPLGGFTADAFVQPALLGGQAMTALVFIFIQHFWLGLVAASTAAIQVGIIPRMRRRLIDLGRQRQLGARQLAGRVTEIVEGINTIHAYDTSNYERADIAARLGQIFKIRYELYQWKFMVKFINNFLAQVTPFLFYCIGGYLTIKGSLDVGQLVAVINAYKELPGPLKELIDWDLARQDVQVKYEQVVEQFDGDDLIDGSVQALTVKDPGLLAGALVATNLMLEDDSGGRLLDHTSLRIEPGQSIAIVGRAGSGGDALAEALGRGIRPASGRITVGDTDLDMLPEALTGRRITYVSAECYFFYGTLKDNLLYSLKHAPLTEVTYGEDDSIHRKWEVREAERSGNPDYDINSDWIDYDTTLAIGDDKDILASIIQVLDIVQLSEDVMELAVHSTIDVEKNGDLAALVVGMRHSLRVELERQNLSSLVIPFEPDAYNTEATVGENLLFGTVSDPTKTQHILRSSYFKTLMLETGLARLLFDMGVVIAENTVELFRDLPPDHAFFQRLTYMAAEDVPAYQQRLQKLQSAGYDDLNDEERIAFLRLSFFYVEPRYRFGVLDQDLMDKIVEVRSRFHEELPDDLKSLIEAYDPERYLASANLIDNILFGRINHRFNDASRQIRQVGSSLMREQAGLYQRILSLGLDYNMGAGGRRLSSVQRLKLNLARALIRRSDYYIVNRALAGLDHHFQEKVVVDSMEFIRQHSENASIVWVLSNASLAKHFQRVIVFDQGSVVEDETYETFSENSAIYKELMAM